MAKKCEEPDCVSYVPERDPPIKDAKCLFHSEDVRLVEARRSGRSKGGTAKAEAEAQDIHPPSRPESFADLAEWVSWLIEASASGAISQTKSDTLGKLITRYRKLLPEVREEQELEEKIQEITDANKRLRSSLENERATNRALRSKIERLEAADSTPDADAIPSA
jgi:predicted RNase H-like nuclease (RuvC/YqgF family)